MGVLGVGALEFLAECEAHPLGRTPFVIEFEGDSGIDPIAAALAIAIEHVESGAGLVVLFVFHQTERSGDGAGDVGELFGSFLEGDGFDVEIDKEDGEIGSGIELESDLAKLASWGGLDAEAGAPEPFVGNDGLALVDTPAGLAEGVWLVERGTVDDGGLVECVAVEVGGGGDQGGGGGEKGCSS